MLVMLDESSMEYDRPRRPPNSRKCGRACTTIPVTVCFIVIVILLAILAIDMTQRIHIVYIDGTKPVLETSDKFLSIALDSSVIANGFKHFNISDPRIIKIMKALSPAYLRIGGTMADRLIFTTSNVSNFKHHFQGELDGGECAYDSKFCDNLDKPNFTMNAQEWLQLNKLAQETNLEIIFDLNVLQRFENGTWDYRNAEELISFSNQHNLYLHWELGNGTLLPGRIENIVTLFLEPNAFRHKFDYEVDPNQLAKDFHTLKNILKKYPKYATSLVVGPDVTRPENDHKKSRVYLKQFLVQGGEVIDAVTWHQYVFLKLVNLKSFWRNFRYYFNGATAQIADFMNPDVFDVLKWQITVVKDIVKNDKITHKPIWLGETSSAYGGGAPHLSNRYVATFIWLDKLGLSAKYGLDVVIRQSIFQGHYALINYNYNTTPDWWVSILYKKLVSRKVVDCHMPQSTKIRLYCQCTKKDSYFENIPSVTVFGVNIDNHKARIRFEGIGSLNIEKAENLTVYAYVLTATDKIDSRFIYLNDKLLTLTKTNDVPDLQPKTVRANPYVVMPAHSLVFWVVPTENLLPYC